MRLVEVKLDEFELVGNAGADIQIDNFHSSYSPVMRTLQYKAEAESLSSHSRYPVHITILNVRTEEVQSKEDADGNRQWFISDTALEDKDVKVDCACKQYVMGGCYKGNKANNCQLYPDKVFDNYERKTDNPNLTKNPDLNPQLCKHLVAFVKWINHNATLSSLYQ